MGGSTDIPWWTDEFRDDLRRRMVAGVDTMTSPVRCAHCGRYYDLGTVEVAARYTDCSMWISPCCRRQVDDRGSFWKSSPDYTVLPPSHRAEFRLDTEGDPT